MDLQSCVRWAFSGCPMCLTRAEVGITHAKKGCLSIPPELEHGQWNKTFMEALPHHYQLYDLGFLKGMEDLIPVNQKDWDFKLDLPAKFSEYTEMSEHASLPIGTRRSEWVRLGELLRERYFQVCAHLNFSHSSFLQFKGQHRWQMEVK